MLFSFLDGRVREGFYTTQSPVRLGDAFFLITLWQQKAQSFAAIFIKKVDKQNRHGCFFCFGDLGESSMASDRPKIGGDISTDIQLYFSSPLYFATGFTKFNNVYMQNHLVQGIGFVQGMQMLICPRRWSLFHHLPRLRGGSGGIITIFQIILWVIRVCFNLLETIPTPA